MLIRKLLCLVAAVGVSAALAPAAPIVANLQPTSVPELLRDPNSYTIAEIQAAGGIIIGDKCFDSFDVRTTLSVNAVAPGADEIAVTPIQVLKDGAPFGGDYGMVFNGPWSAPAGQFADSTIEFRAYILPDYVAQGYAFKDNVLGITAFGVANTTEAGAVSVSENLYVNHPLSQDPQLFVEKFVYYKSMADNQLTDEENFAPITEMWVKKDVVAYGGTGAVGMVHLSEFYQTFSQVPEPATIGLLAAGGSLLLLRRKKKA